MGAGYAAAVRGLGLAVALLAWRVAAAAQAPSSGSGCMPELVRLSPCMGYMSGNATAPDAACCSALSATLRSGPGCLCALLGGTAASLGVAVDGARALRLPAACKAPAPPASQCDAVGVPLPSPAPGTTAPGSPAAVAPPDDNITPAGSGSKATPAAAIPYSRGNVSKPGRIFFVSATAAAVALLRHSC